MNINNNGLDLNINAETENTNYEEEYDEPNEDIQIEGARCIEDLDLLENIKATTDHQNDSPTNTTYATEFDEEQTSNLQPINEEEPLTRGLEEDKERDEMRNNYRNNENRNRPEKENVEEDGNAEEVEVDIYNDRTLRDRAKVYYHKLQNYGRKLVINLN